jgi:hypothetical protein
VADSRAGAGKVQMKLEYLIIPHNVKNSEEMSKGQLEVVPMVKSGTVVASK